MPPRVKVWAAGRPRFAPAARLPYPRAVPFSARTRWDRTRNRLAEALAARRLAGRPVLDLTESNPTAVGLAAPPDLLQWLADPAGVRYAPEARGLESARAAVAADFRRRGLEVGPERLVLTASTSEAYAFLFKLLCDPGDAVLVPRPSYPLFEYLARLEGVSIRPYPLRYDGEWHVDLPALEAALGSGPQALVVVNPNNPTGSFLSHAEAERVLASCAAAGVAVVSDEVFADYALADRREREASLAFDGPALAFSLGGLSKSCGLPQLKLAWIAVTGPEPLRREALERLEIVADTYLSVATPVQLAAPHLLARLAELQAPIRERVRRNLDHLREAVVSSPVSLLKVEGGWSAVLRVPATLPEDERALRLLDRHGVLAHPGYFFDFEQEAFLVVSLLPERTTFADGVGRLLEAFGE